ncbi:MAG: ABC transporter permease [Tannerella sp.]|jgi:ABC-2 type transport system permease protein|nr:ABC transporter permease [Tannerella sp.]
MSKLFLVIKREYIWRVTKKSFLLLTLLMPLLFVAMIFVPLWLASIRSNEVRNVIILDETGKYAQLFEDTESYRFLYGDRPIESYRQDENDELFAFLNITGDLTINPKAAILYSGKQIPPDLAAIVNRVLTKQIENDKLASYNIPDLDKIIEDSRVSFNIQTVKWSDDGSETESSTVAAHIIGMLSTIIIYMFIMMYGAMVMNGVMEEKTNRIVELMVSSVRPFDLMMGKIVGIGLVGLTQIAIWALSIGILIVGGSLFGSVPSGIEIAATTPQAGIAMAADPSLAEGLKVLNSFSLSEILLYFVICFIGGYLIYSSVFAAIGSAVNSPEDTHQFMTPITIILIFALYIGIYSSENPDGPVAFWCSLIPFTSPIVMMMRIPFDVPLWEKIVSVTLLFIFSIGFVWLAARIYRVGILMYGKKPHLKEILKWITFR